MLRITTKVVVPVVIVFALLPSAGNTEPVDRAAAEFIELYVARRFAEAARLFHCPPQQSPAERKFDREALEASLRIMAEIYGRIQSARQSSSAGYLSPTAACGTATYWKEFPTETILLFDTVQRNNERGYLAFEFSRVDGQLVLFQFGHGLPAEHPDALSRAQSFISRKMEK